jgi:hypothetical protein
VKMSDGAKAIGECIFVSRLIALAFREGGRTLKSVSPLIF